MDFDGDDFVDVDDEDGSDRPSTREARRGDALRWRERLTAAAGDRLPPTVRAALWAMDGRAAVVLVVVAAAAVIAAVLAFGGSPRTDAVVVPTFEPAPTAVVTDPTVSESAPGGGGVTATGSVVVVDVAGLVARPGVYELSAGSRVVDAVDAAGGAIVGTDLSQLNLARVLVDGEQIAVGVPAAPAVPGAQPSGSSSTAPDGPLDLNTASVAQLDELPGVGPVLAERIVAWRDENGRFTSVEELMEVSGIGTATFADLEPLVRV